MSRWIVSTDLIDLLATAARRIRNGRMHDGFFDFDDETPTSAVATALFELNYTVVDENYGEETERPEYTFQPVAEILEGPLKPRHLVQIYQAANSYMYQTGGDAPQWAYSLPWATVNAIRFWAEKLLHELGWPIVKQQNTNTYDWAGIEGTEWVWTREHGFPELEVKPGRLDDDQLRETIKSFEIFFEQTLEQMPATLVKSRVSLLARLLLPEHPDAAYLILEPEGGRFARGTVFRDDGERLAEVQAVRLSQEAQEHEASTQLSLVDPDQAASLTEFERQGAVEGPEGSYAIDLAVAAAWSPASRRPRPSE
ncbi:hypothetical protein [Sinomonas gamaensis]|uniref:hypothetical protein n=1 Tax=Sinomonas gamaensis TaxID=2565624 RepID=UPI00110843F2|nr:hypothetical protein [Sinomonas gamaensis]